MMMVLIIITMLLLPLPLLDDDDDDDGSDHEDHNWSRIMEKSGHNLDIFGSSKWSKPPSQ